jgi:large subunit ribosomal protein L28
LQIFEVSGIIQMLWIYIRLFYLRKIQVAFKEVQIMAKCAICEKAAHFGNAVSHSHRRSNKMWKANVKSVKVKVNGGAQKMYVCTSCLRSGLVERA